MRHGGKSNVIPRMAAILIVVVLTAAALLSCAPSGSALPETTDDPTVENAGGENTDDESESEKPSGETAAEKALRELNEAKEALYALAERLATERNFTYTSGNETVALAGKRALSTLDGQPVIYESVGDVLYKYYPDADGTIHRDFETEKNIDDILGDLRQKLAEIVWAAYRDGTLQGFYRGMLVVCKATDECVTFSSITMSFKIDNIGTTSVDIPAEFVDDCPAE